MPTQPHGRYRNLSLFVPNLFRDLHVYHCGMRLDLLRPALAAALVLTAAAAAAADDRTRERVIAAIDALAVPLTSPMVVDGNFDEAVWRDAPAIDEFVQREPTEGAAPTERTEARVAYDDQAMYVAVRAFDREPASITGLLTRRDERSPSDWVRVAIDSYHDRRSAFEFAVNPAGVKADRYHYNDGQWDDSWDAVWDVEVAKDADGWRAEFRIPFSQLRFAAATGPVGFALFRELPRANETSTWPLIARSAQGFVSQFGEVTGLTPGGSPKRLELLPYTLGEVVFEDVEEGDPITEPTNPGAAAGLDLKYAVTPALTLTATLNPDFGQVEADPAAVNLEAFELFFSERRPFFVEGSGIFRFNMDCNDGACTGLLYSRRIGRVPQVKPDLADDEYISGPAAVTILGAAKLAGRIGAFSVGALSAVTQEEQATIASGLERTENVVEPLAGFNVLRARREFANRSNLGMMLTTTNRRITPDTRFIADSAVTGGVDYDWRLGERYSVSGFWAGSRVAGDAEAITKVQKNAVHYYQQPDMDHLELDETATSILGHAGSVSLSKIAGEKVRFSGNYGYKSPGLRDERPRVPAPRRRADDEPLGAVAQPDAGQVQAPVHGELQPVGRLELRRRQPVERRQRQHALVVAEQLAQRLRRERECRRPARPPDPRRAGGARQPLRRRVALRGVRRPAGGVPGLQRLHRRRRPGHLRVQRQPEGDVAADARGVDRGGPALQPQQERLFSGSRTWRTTTAPCTTSSGGWSSAPWR